MVPEILLSGDHAEIALWRRHETLKRTLHSRPDLLSKAWLSEDDRNYLHSLGYHSNQKNPKIKACMHMAKSDFKFSTTIRVLWMEGDAQGIVFNGAYLDYLEIAQAEYFRNLGFSIYQIAKAGYFDSAVVKTTIEFKNPAKVDQLIDLYTRVVSIGNTSITLDLEIYPKNSDQMLSLIHI